MNRIKKTAVLALSLGMLTACSGSGSGSGSATAAPADDAEKKTSVVIAIDADLNTMDYQYATDGNSFIMQTLCIAGLTELDADGVVQPDMAETWEVSEDGLDYTFHLRDGIAWSDGTPVTADDFVFAWRRLVDPALASEYNFLLDTAMHVENAADVITGAQPLEALGVAAPDEKTFTVHLSSPCGFFLGLCAFPSTFPLNQAFFEAQGDKYAQSVENQLYNGPFVMSDRKDGSIYTFTKNPDYWNADSIDMESISFQLIQDTQSAMMSYENGTLDVVKLVSEQVEAYADQDGYTSNLSGFLWYISPNYTHDFLNNADLREAIMFAIDRDTICDLVLKDGSVAARGIIPRAFAIGPDGKDYCDTTDVLVGYDPERAAAAWARAQEALGDELTISLLFEDSEASKAVAENLKSMIEAACPGLTISLDQKPKKTRLELMRSLDPSFELGLTRWGPDYADPQTYMDLFKSDVAGYNGSFSNDDYNAIVNKAENGADAADPEARWQDMKDAEKLLIADLYAMIPVYQNGGAMMINPAIDGIEFHAGAVDNYRHIHNK
ncbi:MAG: peptide ABC transporter substrate-binding protein [Solobacterium sp.]|nr:peptide ABC transporter substrate-binding protein [Solobacterium sp.]MBQ1356136.1 peptide ABC transporter substrate-binding protein [Solobacterium sp.]